MEHLPVRINELLEASIDKVWNAITDKESMKEWYFDIPDFKLEKGAIFNFFEPGAEKRFHHRCEILEIIPHQKFQHTWTYPKYSDGVSVVTWELVTEENNNTRVFLTHEGIENFADAGEAFKRESYLGGWTEIVDNSLKNFVEKRKDNF